MVTYLGGASDKAGDSQHPLSSLDRTGSELKITHMNGLIFTVSLSSKLHLAIQSVGAGI